MKAFSLGRNVRMDTLTLKLDLWSFEMAVSDEDEMESRRVLRRTRKILQRVGWLSCTVSQGLFYL